MDQTVMKSPGGGKIVMQGNKMIIVNHESELAQIESSALGIDKMSVEEVGGWLESIGINPVPFLLHGVSGSDVLNLGDEEFEYLKMTPQEISILQATLKKIPGYPNNQSAGIMDGFNKAKSSSGSSAPSVAQGSLSSNPAFKSYDEKLGGDPSLANSTLSIPAFNRGQEQQQQQQQASTSSYGSGGGNSSYGSGGGNSSYGGGGNSSYGGGGNSSYGGGEGGNSSYGGGGNSSYGGGGSSFGGGSGGPPIDRPACNAGFGQVVASKTADLADRDMKMEQELFEAPNTGINFAQYNKIPVETSGRDCPRPISTFDEADLHSHLKLNISLAKFSAPTPVQKYGIPVILAKRDLMACAQTGSGKTAAFMFPVISNLLKDGPIDNVRRAVFPQILIVAPTRELACQIYDEGRKFAYRTFIRPAVIYGGAASRAQIQELREGCQLLIATPGRLNDFCEKGILSLNKIQYLVLDEADRMLDMGFEPQIRKIVDMLPKERQTLMFSATFPVEIQKLAGEFLNDYIFLVVGILSSTSSTIKQEILYVEENDKHSKLLDVCRAATNGLTLIFVQTKKEADTIREYLTRNQFPATAIHGDMDQWDREESLHNFKTGKKPFLVATDVAQRGLDIPNVARVVNFDMPAQVEDYVHRIGRTGRAGNLGMAISFFNDQDTYLANGLVKVLSQADQPVPDFITALATELASQSTRSRYKIQSRDARGNMPTSSSYADQSGGSSSYGGDSYGSGGNPVSDSWN